MTTESARQVLDKVFKKYKITPNEILFDFFLKANKMGKFEKPLIIGISDVAVILIQRKQKICCRAISYYFLPLDTVLLSFGCCHYREVTVQVHGHSPIHAEMLDCGRSRQDMVIAWENWRNFKFYVQDFGEKPKKSKIKKGSFKLGKNLTDPFEDFSFENRSYFLVDQSYYNSWLQQQNKIVSQNESQTQTENSLDNNASNSAAIQDNTEKQRLI